MVWKRWQATTKNNNDRKWFSLRIDRKHYTNLLCSLKKFQPNWPKNGWFMVRKRISKYGHAPPFGPNINLFFNVVCSISIIKLHIICKCQINGKIQVWFISLISSLLWLGLWVPEQRFHVFCYSHEMLVLFYLDWYTIDFFLWDLLVVSLNRRSQCFYEWHGQKSMKLMHAHQKMVHMPIFGHIFLAIFWPIGLIFYGS